MSYGVLTRTCACGVAFASACAVSLLLASVASAKVVCSASSAAELETCVTTANGNGEENEIVLAGGSYAPTTPLRLTNTAHPQLVVGPSGSHVHEAVVAGGGLPVEEPGLFVIGVGVSATFKDFVIERAGKGSVPAVEDGGSLTLEAMSLPGNVGAALTVEPMASASVTNSTLSDGTTFGLLNEGSATVLNSTIAFNREGGIFNTSTGLSLTNTIIAENGRPNCEGSAASTNDHSFSNTGECGAERTAASADLSGLANDLGPTLIHSEQPASPTIDAGDTGRCPAVDQRGFSRPDVVSTACDIGADEWNSTAPTIHVPSEIVTSQSTPEGAPVSFTVTAESPVAAVHSIVCTHKSGSTFPIGTTSDSCTATDGHGNTASGSFNVKVTGHALFKNGAKTGENARIEGLGFGQLSLNVPSFELTAECVNLGFGAGYNQTERTHLEVFNYFASGHAPTAEHSALSANCRIVSHGTTSETSAWGTAEAPLKETRQEAEVCENKEVTELKNCVGSTIKTSVIRELTRQPLSVPWNGEMLEKAGALHAHIGFPTETSRTCEIVTEVPAPAGCVKLQIVAPSLGIDLPLEGFLEPKAISGTRNGLSPSVLEFEGSAEPGLVDAQSRGIRAFVSGKLKIIGFEGQELLVGS
jgi:HYR domain